MNCLRFTQTAIYQEQLPTLFYFYLQIHSFLLNKSLLIEVDCSKCICFKIKWFLLSELFSEDIFTNIIVYRIHRQNELSKIANSSYITTFFIGIFPIRIFSNSVERIDYGINWSVLGINVWITSHNLGGF